MKAKRILACVLAAAMVIPMAACGKKQEVEGKINITIGCWPDDTNPTGQERMAKVREDFMAQYPDINIITDTTYYDSQTLNMKGSANQLVTLYSCPVTEVSTASRAGYALPITKYMDKYGYTEAMNPEVLDVCKGDDGEIYAIPTSAYKQGFYINKNMFEEAGLVNADGSVKIPKTWDEVAEYAKIVKDKTGKAGFAYGTTNNIGGWLFLNIAKSFGVEEFVVQKEDGSYEAAFNTPECVEAVQYLKDLKWKYDVLLDDSNVDQLGMYKYFGTDQAAMMIAAPPCNWLYSDYKMDMNNGIVAAMPEGPAGAYSQMGADVYMISPDATEEQVDACFKWMQFNGNCPEVSEERVETLKAGYAQQVEKGNPVMSKDPFPIYSKGNAAEVRNNARAEYVNIDMANFDDYFNNSDNVKVFPEPAVCAQQLYAILDKVVQEIFSNENADVAALVEEAANDYQLNQLNKLD